MKSLPILAIFAASLALAACGPRTEQTATTESVAASMTVAVTEDEPRPGNVGDRIVCLNAAGDVILDDFGHNMRVDEGAIGYISWTTGKYAASNGNCIEYDQVAKPMDWKPIMPGLIVENVQGKKEAETIAKSATPASEKAPKQDATAEPAATPVAAAQTPAPVVTSI
jgi:hypothetical protein